jgi:hypothetical protein
MTAAGFKTILAAEALAISLRATEDVGVQGGEIGIWKGSGTVQHRFVSRWRAVEVTSPSQRLTTQVNCFRVADQPGAIQPNL